MAFADYQFEIYLQGLAVVVPSLPIAYSALETRAAAAMPSSVWSYVAGGAGDERTQRANVTAFDRWGLIPRMFVGAEKRDLSVEMFGMTLPSPLFMVPIGVIGICAQDGHGDLATARAAATTGVPMVVSTLTADPLEDVATEFGDTPGLFQLYTPRDRDLAASLASTRPRNVELPAVARALPGKLLHRSGVPRRPDPASRAEPAGRGPGLGANLWQPADLG